MNIDTLLSLIGDVPVSEQIMTAITHHDHKDCAKRTEVEELKQKIDLLLNLIGDTPVSEQIQMAINNTK